MPYSTVVLPATGGALVAGALVALGFHSWVLALVCVMLALSVFGYWRWRRGEQELSGHR